MVPQGARSETAVLRRNPFEVVVLAARVKPLPPLGRAALGCDEEITTWLTRFVPAGLAHDLVRRGPAAPREAGPHLVIPAA